MSAATAPITDVGFPGRNASRDAGHSRARCDPVPLPALGTQRVVRGNGTDVGTVVSLQCPAKHRVVGGELRCVSDNNGTRWVGDNFCKPLSSYEDVGFRVAVLSSIVSVGIILFMSMAFITCCLLDCIKEDKRKRQEREWQMEEDAKYRRENHNHTSRNNNNNNHQEKMLSLWAVHNPLMADNLRGCGCQQHFDYGPACTFDLGPPHVLLPGSNYAVPRDFASTSHLLPHPGPPPSSYRSPNPGPVRTPVLGPALPWMNEARESVFGDASHGRSGQDFPIRIISV